MPDTTPDRLSGLVLGGAYQLVGRIGEGGMGAVYEAHHLRLRKRVAVKLLNRDMAKDPDALARFHREASVASRLGHPNLVNVIDFGTSGDGEPYLVMDHLEGEDLDRRIRRTGRIPGKNAVQIARQVASALAAVHAKGIVHRDLKPANVFLVQMPGEPDLVKVLDFGVSKIRAARIKLTKDRAIVGTPEYMSPEQVAGSSEEVDHRADQWALACIVWEMLAGRRPFTGDHINAIFFQLTNLPPPSLSERAPDLPPGIESALLRALSKRPSDRYPSIKEFSRALETAALGSWIDVTPMPGPQADASARPKVPPLRLVTDADTIEAPPREVSGRAGAGLVGWLRLRLRVVVAGLTVAAVSAAAGLLASKARPGAPLAEAARPISAAATVAPAAALPASAGQGVATTEAAAARAILGDDSRLRRDAVGTPSGHPRVAAQAKVTDAAEQPARRPKHHARGWGKRHRSAPAVASPDRKHHIFEDL